MACFGANRHCRVLCLFAAVLTAGCIRPRAEVRDPLEARILPVAARSRPRDTMVRPAVADRPQGPDQSLPPALEPAPTAVPRPSEAAGPAPTAADASEEPAGQPLAL